MNKRWTSERIVEADNYKTYLTVIQQVNSKFGVYK